MIAYIIVHEYDRGSVLLAADTDYATIEREHVRLKNEGNSVRIAEIEITKERLSIDEQ